MDGCLGYSSILSMQVTMECSNVNMFSFAALYHYQTEFF